MRPWFKRHLIVRPNLQFFQKVEAFLKHINALLKNFFKMLDPMYKFKAKKNILFIGLKYIRFIFK